MAARIRGRFGAEVAIAGVWIAGATVASAGTAYLSVTHTPSTSSTQEFDPAASTPHPDDMPELEPGRDAITACDFWCKPVLRYRTTATSLDPTGCSAVVEVVELKLVVEMATKSWLPTAASPDLQRQELAHRDICQQVYADAPERLLANGREALRAPLTGRGPDCDAAIENAVWQHAALSFCTPYTADSTRTVRRVGAIYDYLTSPAAHRPLPAEVAIRAAFRQFQREELSGASNPRPNLPDGP